MSNKTHDDDTPLNSASLGQLLWAAREKWGNTFPWIGEAAQLLDIAAELLERDEDQMKNTNYLLLVEKIRKCSANRP